MQGKPAASRRAIGAALLVAAAAPAGCARLIALYDQRAYENATSLKAEAVLLMGRAGEPYAEHKRDAQAVMVHIQAAYEYARGIPNNAIAADLWRQLTDPDTGLLLGFLALWEQKGRLLPGDIDANRDNVARAFDQIIELEAAKIRK